jgi:hypothetical protein
VNEETVRCNARGYGLEELKINIKGLDGFTILDHSNVRFGDKNGAPCLTAGICKGLFEETGFDINDVIQNNPRVEKVTVNRVLKELRTLDDKKCEKTLIEVLDTEVGGVKFNHTRSLAAEVLPASSCTF